MNIAILGAGNIGANAARLFAHAGHAVAISRSGDPESLAPLVAELGANARAASNEEALAFGDVVLVAVPFRARQSLPAADHFAGKIVIDSMNAYTANFQVEDFSPSTSSEEFAKQVPGARVVKAFNHLNYQVLRVSSGNEGAKPVVLFVAGDDADAKKVVSNLIEEIGFVPMDTGSLHDGGIKQQANAPLYNKPMTETEAHAALAAL